MNIHHICLSETVIWKTGCDFLAALCSFNDILKYLSELDKEECIYYCSDFFDQPIFEDCVVWQCYETKENDPLADEKRLISELIGKMRIDEGSTEGSTNIGIEFYPLTENEKPPFRSAYGLNEYLSHRRSVLVELASPLEFYDFMRSCFSNSAFSKNISDGLKKVSNFNEVQVRQAIVDDLSILNDHALDIYNQFYPDQEKMFRALETMVLACGPDPQHKNKLCFEFTYMEGQEVYNKMVYCSPHTKLLRKDSNLRIYFLWKDDDIASDKVLIGHIGQHPY